MNATTLPSRLHRHRSAAAAALALSTALALVACADTDAEEPSADVSTTADEATGTDDHTASADLQTLADHAVQAGIPSVLVRVDGGDEPYDVAAAVDWAAPADTDDTFRVGSNSKTATAVLLLQLVDAGALDLDAPLSTWFDDLPGGDAMTVRMLLNHTSGLDDHVYDPAVLATMAGLAEVPPTDDELIALGLAATETAEPVDGFRYSNTGYILLGQILEQVTGSTVADLFEANIAQPLGLTETWFASPERNQPPTMHGYEPDADGIAPMLPEGTPEGFSFVGDVAAPGWIDVTAIDQSWGGASGSIVSTATEWATFQRALLSGELISAGLLDQMRETVPEDGESGPGRSYGLGLEMVETSCGIVWGHDGALPGYRADTYVDELGERSMTVVSATHFTLSLQEDAGVAHEELVDAAACAMYEQPVPTPGG